MATEEYTTWQWAKVAIIKEFGGDTAQFRAVAREAKRRGMYSEKTAVGDIERALERIWRKTKRLKNLQGACFGSNLRAYDNASQIEFDGRGTC